MQVIASTVTRGDGAIDDIRGPLRLTAKAAAFVGGPLFLLGVLLHPARDGEGVRAAGQLYGITHDMQAIGLLLQAISLISIYVLGTREFGRRGLLAVYAAVVGTLLWFAVILGDGLVNPVTARYAPERVHNAADLDVGAMIIAVPATFLFPVGYVVLARLLARHGSKWPGLLTAIGAVVYVIGGMSLLAFGPHSPVIQVVEVAGAVPYALGFVLLGLVWGGAHQEHRHSIPSPGRDLG